MAMGSSGIREVTKPGERLLWVTMWRLFLFISLAGTTYGESQTGCNFGLEDGCKFPCRCADGAACDSLTGQCPDGNCLVNEPSNYPDEAGWKDPGCQTGNVAYSKDAWQYRQYDTWEAGRSVDGQISTYIRNGGSPGCSHPAGRGLAWWTVDLGSLHTVYSVTLMNTRKPSWRYMKNLRVYVSNSSLPRHVNKDDAVELNTTADIGSYGYFAVCGDWGGQVNSGQDAKVPCATNGRAQPLVGRYVLVWKYRESESSKRGSFVPCEITVLGHRYAACNSCDSDCNPVYGCIANCPDGKNQTTFCSEDCADGYYGYHCRQTCSDNCVNSTPCDNADGACRGGCKLWWTDTHCTTAIDSVPATSALSLEATDVSSHTLTLKWTSLAVASSVLDPHYGYVIQQLGPDSQWEDAAWVNYTRTQNVVWRLSDLSHNTLYTVRLQAYRRHRDVIDRVTIGQPLNVKTSCTAPIAPTVSVEAYNVSRVDAIVTEINVSWSLVGSAMSGCDFVTSYQVSTQKSGGSWETKAPSLANSSTSFVFSPPEDGEYMVKVTVRNNENLEAYAVDTVAVRLYGIKTESSVGLKVGVSISVIIIIAAIIALVIWFVRRKEKTGHGKQQESNLTQGSVCSTPKNKSDSKKAPTDVGKPTATKVTQVWRKDEATEEKTMQVSELMEEDEDEDCRPQPQQQQQQPNGETVYANYAFTQEAIPLHSLEKFAADLRKEKDGFKLIHDTLPKGDIHPNTIGMKEDNKAKNRFLNIVAYDHTRVILESTDRDGYINASYIKGYKGKEKAYVATQGPKPDTMADFWQMVWQLKSTAIVMLTQLVENSKRKCNCYWPNTVGEVKTYGTLTVELKEMQTFADYIQSTLVLRNGGTERTVSHLQYMTWPDKQRPLSVFSLLAFLWHVRDTWRSETAPLVVHCSAGVGRTGTFIGLDYLLREAEDTGHVSINRCVTEMRQQRTRMVQTLAQYMFIYEALVDSLKAGRTALTCDDYKDAYARLLKKKPNGDTQLKLQFEVLRGLISEQPAPVATEGRKEINRAKNRYPDIVPDENYRPYLSTRYEKGNDYINAVFVKGFRSDRAFIATQAPLRETVVDLWRLVYDVACGTIVMLNNPLDAPTYWPEENKSTYGPLEVTLVETIDHKHWVIRDLEVRLARRKLDSLPVRQYQLKTWQDGRPDREALNAFLELHEAVMTNQQRTPTQPVLVHCLDGVTRCGLFCAVDHVIGNVMTGGKADVFLAARNIATGRQEFLQDMNGYIVLHDIVLEYLSKFETYANYR